MLLSSFDRVLKYKFRNTKHLIRALTHSSIEPNSNLNSGYLEFLGWSGLSLALMHESILCVSVDTPGTELVATVDRILGSSEGLIRGFEELELYKEWRVPAGLAVKAEEQIWTLAAVAGAMFVDSGYRSLRLLARYILENSGKVWNSEVDCNSPLPWGAWRHRVTLNYGALDLAFSRNLSEAVLEMAPWALEIYARPGSYNQRSPQLFELGEIALRWAVDYHLYQHKMLEPLERRHLLRERMLRTLGLESRVDQAYAAAFVARDWRRQSLDNRTHSLKNLLGALLVADGEVSMRAFVPLVLRRKINEESEQTGAETMGSRAA